MQTDTGVSRQLEAPTESAAPNFPLNPPRRHTIPDQYSPNEFYAHNQQLLNMQGKISLLIFNTYT